LAEIIKGLLETEGGDFYRVVTVHRQPIFSNDILDFWNPNAHLPGYEDGYDVGLCHIKKPFAFFDRMECHKSSCEVLIPINDDMFVPLAPPGDVPKNDLIEIVSVKMGELIVMDEGVWHFAAGPVNHSHLDYFVFIRRGTPENDLEMKELGITVRLKF